MILFKKREFYHQKGKYIHYLLIICMFMLIVPAGFNSNYLNLIMFIFGLVVLNRGIDYRGYNNKEFYKCLSTGVLLCLVFAILFVI